MSVKDSGTRLETMSDDIFDKLMNDVPDGARTEPVGGSQPDPDPKEDPKDPKDVNEDPKDPKDPDSDTDQNEPPKRKTKEDIDKAIDAALGADVDPNDLDDKDPEPDEDGDPDPEPSGQVDEDFEKEFFKTKAQTLIEKGIWFDVDDIDNIEWSEETYGKMVEQQAQWRAEDAYNERLEQLGEYKKIIEHIENGGDPQEVLNLFKEVSKVNSLDITSETGQKQVIRQYYKNTVGWSDSKINRYIDGLIDDGEDVLKQEAEEAKESLEARLREEADEVTRQQEEYREQQIRAQEQFKENMTNVINERKDIPLGDRRKTLKSLLEYNTKLPDGRVVNEFTVNLMKMQSDPEQYLNLVMFVNNPEQYLEKVEEKGKKEEKKKTWNLLKDGASLKRDSGSKQPKRKDQPKGDLDINYKDFL